MRKITDTFGRSKFWLPQNFMFYAKAYAADRVSNLKLLMLVIDFKVHFYSENTQRYFSGMHGMF